MDQNAIEELFERNADMRLLELRHSELGKGALPTKRMGSTFGAESIMASTPDENVEKAPQLRVGIAAAPSTGVIPGAVVGVAIDVYNDGGAPAPESTLLLSVPIEMQYRDGTLRIDGREPQAPERLFGEGLPIARLPGASSTKVTLQLAILPGVNTLYLQPRLQAVGVPVVGTAGISVKRGSGTAAPQPGPAPKPFYELEADEIAEVAAETAEIVMPPVLARDETPLAEPVAAIPAIVAVPEIAVPEAPAQQQPLLEEPAAAPAPAPRKRAPAKRRAPAENAEAESAPKAASVLPVAAADERMSRYRSIAASDVALLERLFTAPVPGVIGHYIMISAIACNEPGGGPDASGYDAFLRRDIESLGRALVHMRMGKTAQYKIVQDDLAPLALAWEAAPPAPVNAGALRLRRDLRKQEWAAIGGLLQPSPRDATLRTRIALLALAGSNLDGGNAKSAIDGAAALGAYRSAALAWLVPLCVASANSDSFVIPSPPPSVDDAGRTVVAALKAALGS
jgi:hypothetical protein